MAVTTKDKLEIKKVIAQAREIANSCDKHSRINMELADYLSDYLTLLAKKPKLISEYRYLSFYLVRGSHKSIFKEDAIEFLEDRSKSQWSIHADDTLRSAISRAERISKSNSPLASIHRKIYDWLTDYAAYQIFCGTLELSCQKIAEETAANHRLSCSDENCPAKDALYYRQQAQIGSTLDF